MRNNLTDVTSMGVYLRMKNLSLFVRKLKRNHKSLGSYAFILEDGGAANSQKYPKRGEEEPRCEEACM
jgi:hypothetical protein